MNGPREERRMGFSAELVQFIDERCDQYEKEWNALVAPRIEDYLGDAEGTVRTTLWLELALLDQELREVRGETIAIEEYRDRCPDRKVLLDVSTAVWAPCPPLTVVPGPGTEATAESLAVTPTATPVGSVGQARPDERLNAGPVLDHDDATADVHKPLADPLLNRAGSGGELTGPINVPPTINALGDNNSDPLDGPAYAYPGAVLGNYLLIDKLARGGMGIVFKARQQQPNRIVALKTIRAGQLAEARDIRLFKSEAEAVAALDHPNIVPIFEVGEDRGLHFYSMKLIVGRTLHDSLARFKDQPAAIASLVRQIAEAIQHAHQRGVLHRDLKPANILVDLEGKPHVIDFGLAKRLGTEGETTTGLSAAGTPSYMAPEQAERRREAITTATDVYGLGTILYGLLTGCAPFRSGSITETLRQVVNEEPKRPRSLDARIDRDLETICLKCLEKAPKNRYGSASDLADDLSRWLDGKPILARPASTTERISKYIRRHPAVSVLLGLLVLTMTTGSGGIIWQWRQAVAARERLGIALLASRQNEEEALKSEDLARHLAYGAKLTLAGRDWEDANVAQVKRQLDQTRPPPGKTDLRGFEWYYLDRLMTRSQGQTSIARKNAVSRVAYSHDGKRLASTSDDQIVKVWDTGTGQVIHSLVATRTVRAIAFHPSGSRLASAGSDQTVTQWDTGTGQIIRSSPGHTRTIEELAYSPDGKTLASSSRDGTVKLWDADAGSLFRTLKDHPDAAISKIIFSPDSKFLLSAGGSEPTTRIWDVATGQNAGTLKDTSGLIAISADGKTLVTSSVDGTIKVWDFPAKSVVRTFKDQHNLFEPIKNLALSRHGKTLASIGITGQAVTIWDTATGSVLRRLKGHTGTIIDLAFSPDDVHLASTCNDAGIRIWDTAQDQEARSLSEKDVVADVAFGPDGSYLAAASSDRTVNLWDLSSGQVIRTFQSHTDKVKCVAIRSDGRFAASAGNDKIVRIWEVATGQEVQAFKGHSDVIWSVAFSPDGKTVASGADDQMVKVWDVAAGREIYSLKGHIAQVNAVAFSPDGKSLVSGDNEGFILLWELHSGHRVKTYKSNSDGIRTIAISPNGQWLASGGYDQSIYIWDIATGRETHTLPGHAATIQHLAFSPDSRRLASASSDRTVRIWDPVFGQEVLVLRGHNGDVWTVTFSPDGSRLASGSGDRTVKIWETSTGQALP